MRNDPWTAWTRMWDAGVMMNEMLQASGRVIDHRKDSIAQALCSPMESDVGELGRMVSEKVEAFGKAGNSLASDWWTMQADITAQAVAVGQAVMTGRVPTGRAAKAMAARQQRLGDQALASSMRALRPIHATATANARRLGKRKPR